MRNTIIAVLLSGYALCAQAAGNEYVAAFDQSDEFAAFTRTASPNWVRLLS